MDIQVGQTWRATASVLFVVVGVDEPFIYVKLAKSTKKQLATVAGAHCTTRSEMEREWTLVQEVAAMREP